MIVHFSLPLTHAVVSSIDLHVFRGTHTGVVAQSVIAGTRSTDPKAGNAFIDICEDMLTNRPFIYLVAEPYNATGDFQLLLIHFLPSQMRVSSLR